MRITMKKLAVAFAALAAFVGVAGDSAPFLLDTADGTRIAAEGEAIPVAYSPRWGNAASCTVTTAGAPSLRTDEGEIIWTPQGIGGHTLMHTAGDLVYTAQFAVLGDDVAVAGGRLSSSAVWTADKTYLITAPLTVPSGVSLTIQAGAVVKFMPGTGLTVSGGGSCIARGAIFTHANDDTVGGDTLCDGDETSAVMGEYTTTGSITDDDSTEYRYMPPQTLTSRISSNTRLRGYRTYIVSNSVTVVSGATLTLQPGTILKFNTGCSLTVNGTLDAQGTRAAPIVFTSLKDDAHGGDTNGDGEKTYAQAGDWYQISVPGTANFNYCHVLYNSSTENTGAIDARGGTVNFDNSEIAHTKYECVNAHNSGYFTARNSIFRDSSLGFGYYGSGRVKAYNCVFSDLTSGIRQSGKTLINCVFNRCLAFTDQSGDGSTFKNCVFYNPVGYGAQSYSKCGSNGNIWGNPLFTDPDNGDFRIAANSPCVDAGDGSVAPATDYWGQPRMDVKRVKDTGTPNGDGVCPDIGIYEVPGSANVPLPDLAVVSISRTGSLPVQGGNALAARCTAGDAITITYVVTNRGAAAVTGIVRDLFSFKAYDASLGNQTIDAAEIEQAYNVAAGGSAEFTASLTVPTLKAGAWKVEVGVNVGNYPYEQNLSNNRATTEDAISVELEAMGMGTQSVMVGKGESVGFVLSGLPTAGGVVHVTGGGAAQIAAYGGNGAVPTSRTGCQPVQSGNGQAARCTTGDPAVLPLADGSLLVVFPARVEGENAYLVLENGGNAAATVSVEVKETELALYDAAPGRIANVGEATVTITGSGLVDGGGHAGRVTLPTVTLGGREAKSVEVLNAAQIAATFDVDGMAAGRYAVSVSDGEGAVATQADAVEIYAAKTGPKLRAWLEMPSSVRDGRVFTGYVCYANEGDSPMTMPVFKIAREDSNTKMGLVASESMTETTLYVGGISPTHPAGVLKAGDAARIPFYFQPFGTYRIKLSHIKDAEDLEAYPTFGGTKAYLAAMSVAATRLNLRGRTAYNVHDFVDQALWEKNGVAHAAASGYLVDAKTGEPIANASVSLVDAGGSRSAATDPDAADATERVPPVVGTTDESGYFQLTNLADGEYRWLLDDGNTLADASTNTVTIAGQTDLNGQTVYATLGGRISGYVTGDDGTPVGGAGVARMDVAGSVIEVTMADEYGAYRFSGLADGTNVIRAIAADGWATEDSEPVVIDEVMRSAEVSVTMRKGGIVSGIVTKDGRAVTNGFVRAVAQNGTAFNVAVGEDGRYLFDGLAAGRYQIGYYSATDVSEDGYVTLAAGDSEVLEFSATARPLFEPALRVGFGKLETKFFFTDPNRATNVVAWAWDFESDGIVDSTSPNPTWTYASLGTNTVTLTITENGGARTTSVYPDCVRIEKAVETILKEGAIVYGTNFGTLETLELGKESLVLSGAPAGGEISVGSAILGKYGDTWYVRRVVGVSRSGDRWTLTTEEGKMTDVYEQFAMSVSAPAELGEPPSRPLLQSAGTGKSPRLMASTPGADDDGFHLFAEGGVTAKMGIKPDLRVSLVQDIRNGRDYSMWAFIGEITLEGSIGIEGNAGARYKESYPIPFTIKIPTSVPFLTAKAEAEVYTQFTAQISGTAGIQGHLTQTIQVGMERYDEEDWKWLKPFPAPEAKVEPYGDVEGSFEGRFGVIPKFGLEWLAVSATVDLDLFISEYIKAGLKSPLSFGAEVGADLRGEADLKVFNKNIGQWFTPSIEGPRFQVVRYVGPDPEFSFSPSENLEAPAGVQFTNKTAGPKIRLWRNPELQTEATRYEWNFDNGTTSTERNPYVTFTENRKYKVSLKAFDDDFITGPYRYKATVMVGEKDDDDGDEETDDSEQDTPKKSCDPNEVNGPMGVGEARYVKPGQELTYTIYFENKAGFDIADAQEVKVTNPLSEWLDWSTFEMREVAFNNQNDNSLDGLSGGTRDIKMNGTNKYVRVALGGGSDGAGTIAETGVVHWYLRVYDPNGQFGWPNDLSGFLPSNDDTHRGEGHLTYRIKVREDAPANVVITNSASIVFDTNDPIETDPAWWNTVTPVEESFAVGAYFKATLAELGYDVPTDGKTAYNVVAKGLPAGLQLKYNAAVTKKVKEKGKTKTVVVKPAKVEWWIEGVPTAALDFFTNPPYLVITVNGKTTVEALPLEVLAQEVVDLGELALGQSININGWLSGVGAGWTVSGLPTGLSFATKNVTKKVKSGKKTVTQTVAEAYAVYGKTTKAGLFTITAKKKKGTYYETKKFRVLVTPKAVDVATFGEELANITTMAHVPVSWKLAGGDGGEPALPVVPTIAKVAGLPTGLTFAAANVYAYKNAKKKTGKYVKQYGQTIVGTPTKPGTYVVTFTRNVTTGAGKNKKTVAKTSQILWKIVQNDAKLELGFNTSGGVVEGGVVGLNYGDLMAFTATSNATVTASGMPEGIKLSNLGNGQYAFTGFTTKAGTYLVTVKATLKGKTVTQRLALKVEGLPAWAKGTYNGNVKRKTGDGELGDEFFGLATVTVSAAGKISGKFYDGGTNWTLSAASYTERTDDAFFCTNVVAKYAYKVTKKVKEKGKTVTKTETKYVMRRFSLEVGNEEPWDGVRRGYAVAAEQTGEDDADGVTLLAWQNLWGSTYKDVGKALFSTKSGKTTLAYRTFTVKGTTDEGAELGLDERMTLALKVTTAGAVTATMTYDTGKTVTDKKTKKRTKVYYKPTCQAVVIPATAPDSEKFEGEVYLFFAPSAANNFPGYVATIPL